MDNFVISTKTKKELKERKIQFLKIAEIKIAEKIQFLFQIVKIQFQCRRDIYSRSSSWVRSSDRKQQDQSSQEMKNSYSDKRSRIL